MNQSAHRASSAVRFHAWREWLFAVLVSAAAALAIVAIFAVRGNPSGHDFEFHAASWLEVAMQWRHGILYPRWAEWANWGFGEPRFIFYPPLSWILGATLGLTVGWRLVAGAFVVVSQTIAGASMFALARRTLPQRSALLAALCYAANPYALLVIYLRSDFAEQLGAAFLPLLFLTLSDLAEAEERRQTVLRAALFAIVFAVMWLCNAPAGVLASYSATLLFAWLAMRTRSWRPLARGVAGIGLGFGLCAFYLVPAAYEQRWVRIGEALSSGLRPSENFLYTMTSDPEHNLFNWIASTTAVGMIALTGFSGVAARRQAKDSRQEELWKRLMLLAATASVLMISISWPLWRFLPEIAFLQFPWRWMLVLGVPFAYFLAAAARGRFGWVWIVLFFAAAGYGGKVFVQQTWWGADDMPTLRDAIADEAGYEGVDEYDPIDDDRTNLAQNTPEARVLAAEEGNAAPAAKVDTEKWETEEKIVRVTAQEPARVALRLLNYPAWRVEVSGTVVKPESAENSGQMMIMVPAGESRIQVRFIRTRDRTAGTAISAAGSVLIALLLGAARRWGRRKSNETFRRGQHQRRSTAG